DTVLLQDALHPADGVACAVQELADATQKVDVVGAVIAPPAGALHRPDLAESAFPETQHMLRDVEVVGDLADCAKGVRRFVQSPGSPGYCESPPFSWWPLMRCLRIADGLNTITRRGEIGTSLPVLGLRPMRWPFLRTTKEPNEDSFTVSPRSRQSVISL